MFPVQVLLEAAVEKAPDLVYSLRPILHKLLDHMPLPSLSVDSVEGERTSLGVQSDTSDTFLTGRTELKEERGDSEDRGGSAIRHASSRERASRWETLEGLVVLHELKAPPDLHLLPDVLLRTIPSR